MTSSTSASLLPKGRLPLFAYVADLDKKISGKIMRHNAIRAPYVQINPKDRVFNMIFDLDCDTGVLDWIDGVPFLPAYFVGRRRDGQLVRPHAVVKLRIPVDLTQWKQATLYYAVRARITELLELEGCIVDDKQPLVTKNPNATGHWSSVAGDNRLWTLDELRSVLGMPEADDLVEDELQGVYRQAGTFFNVENARLGRNCTLFESIRGLAYAQKPHCSSEEQLYEYVLREAYEFDAVNNPRRPQRPSEIKATAKSIAKWTWARYAGAGKVRDINHGACADQIRPEMGLRERQGIGGKYGSKENSRRHEKAVREAIEGRSGWSIKGLARELSMAINTVKKYVRAIQEEVARPKQDFQSFVRALRGVKTVSSEIGEGQNCQPPDIRARRDGKDWVFWVDPTDPETYYDSDGRPAPARYVDPYIIWRSNSDPPDPITPPLLC